MSTIEEQIKAEKRMVSYGVHRYKNKVHAAESKDQSSTTDYGVQLLRKHVTAVSELLAGVTTQSKGAMSRVRMLLQGSDPMVLAHITLKSVINSLMKPTDYHKIVSAIGTAVEDELKFSKFSDAHPEYVQSIIDDFKRKNTTSYRHIHRVLTHKANERNIDWRAWSTADRIVVGMYLIDVVTRSTQLIQIVHTKAKGKTVREVTATQELLDWVKNFHSVMGLLHPDRGPCVIPPEHWTSPDDGGYYTPRLRVRTPLVKTRAPKQLELLEHGIDVVLETVNAIQDVPWRVNSTVYEALKHAWDVGVAIGLPSSIPTEIPASRFTGKDKTTLTDAEKEEFKNWKQETTLLHTLERERVSKCFSILRVLRLAEQYKDLDQFYFVWQCDFRGRLYCVTAGLSPQGADFGKAVLQFARGKRLGETGAYWLAVHGSNMYGNDKVSFDERAKWANDNSDIICAFADNPWDYKDFWKSADEPWQFFAFAVEWAKYKKYGIDWVSHLPIHMDGSCNGLQNFSAMLRDPVGGMSTNLIPCDKPQDIYGKVAEVCTYKVLHLPNDDKGIAQLWKDYIKSTKNTILPRDIAKRPVMTLPYGSTKFSCRDHVYRYIVTDIPEYFPKTLRHEAATLLSTLLWCSITEVVIAARTAMDWLQGCAKILAKENTPIVWWTPAGFPVVQKTSKITTTKIDTLLYGSSRVTVYVGEFTETMSVSKNVAAIAPNFVHSMDACHLMLTCVELKKQGILDFSFVHDSYGAHAADVDVLHKAIRKCFVDMYTNCDVLKEFKVFNEDNLQGELPKVPNKSSLDLKLIHDSKYFFA